MESIVKPFSQMIHSLAAEPNLSAPEMSATSKAMLAKVKQLVPPMLEKFHKGIQISSLRFLYANEAQASLGALPSLVEAQSKF